jgi:hypothetical protein
MLLYGRSTNKLTNFFFWRKKNFVRNIRKKCIYGSNQKQILRKSTDFIFNLPFNWDYVFLYTYTMDKNSIFIYNNTYFFYFVIPNPLRFSHIDRNTQSLTINTFFINSNFNLFCKTIGIIFKSLNRPFIFKLKFKGKGYYIYKNARKTITPQFGHSHRFYLYSYFVSVVFLSKTQVLLFGLVKNDLSTIGHSVRAMRSINIFTGRGVRFSRQVIYKKTGKVSSYR